VEGLVSYATKMNYEALINIHPARALNSNALEKSNATRADRE